MNGCRPHLPHQQLIHSRRLRKLPKARSHSDLRKRVFKVTQARFHSVHSARAECDLLTTHEGVSCTFFDCAKSTNDDNSSEVFDCAKTKAMAHAEGRCSGNSQVRSVGATEAGWTKRLRRGSGERFLEVAGLCVEHWFVLACDTGEFPAAVWLGWKFTPLSERVSRCQSFESVCSGIYD